MSAPTIHEATARLTANGAPFELEEAEVLGRRMRCWKNCPPTVRSVFVASRAYGDRTYLVYEDERISYEECFQRVAGLAQTLVGRYEISKGDRVAIAMRNFPEWVIAFWAASSVGAVVVPLNAWWKGEELEYGLSDSESKLLFVDGERAKVIEPHLAGLALRDVVVARAEEALPAGATPFDEAMGSFAAETELPDVEILPDDDATIFYTSGTTGKPKGALGTQRNLCTNVMSSGFSQARSLLRRGGELPTPGAPREPSATLLSIPFFHVTGCHSTLAPATAAGNKLVMMYRWNAERALELIEREKINSFGGVPSIVWQVLESPSFQSRDTSSVVGISYGGAPAAPELVRRIAQEFPKVTSGQGYGMTETSAITTTNGSADYVRKPDSVGPPVPVCDVKVVDEGGNTLAMGEVGELWIRGPNIVKEYWNKPEATADTFTDGWCHSGDVARIDDEGFVYIVDRAKDMLIRGGENVYCVEVEDRLFAHPAVMDAAVVGMPDRVLGEEVVAAVQIAPSSQVEESELQRHVAEKLARFKVPVWIDLRRDPLPRNANGKIVKQVVKDELLPRWKPESS